MARFSSGPEVAASLGDKLSEQLALPAGEDHFVLVLEGERHGALLGFLSAGGSRDPDGKGGAEIYELVVAEGTRADLAQALVGRATQILETAAYSDVTCWQASIAGVGEAEFTAAGFERDQRATAALRYRRTIHL